MTTTTTAAPQHTTPAPPQRLPERRPAAARPAPPPGHARGWLQRLADWADTQPPHRRLGSWLPPL